MKAGIHGLLALRSSPIRRKVTQNIVQAAHVHAQGQNQTPSPDPMFARANKVYEAKPPARNELAKHLFPSSSPSTSQNGNVMEQLKKSSASGSPSVSARNNSLSSNPSKPRITSVTQFVNNRTNTTSSLGTGSRSLASLYNVSDSFREEPSSVASRDQQLNTKSAVYFAEDDFSDDENLDLDFEAPSALPVLTQSSVTTSKPAHSLPPATQYLDWSSSPAEHFKAPISRTTSNRTTSTESTLKRESQDDFEPSQLPPPKKRSLPKNWKTETNVINLEDEESEYFRKGGEVTPAPKAKTSLPWNTTASAVKAQQKQHKHQSRKPGTGKDLSMEEMEAAVGGHLVKKTATLTLSQEQLHVQDLVINQNQNVFFTGSAGTGKSVLIKSLITELRKKWVRDPERLAVTASTGLAACNIGGITLHSFSGIGLGKDDVPTLVKKIRRNPKAKNRWLRTKVLIIDEISMVDGELLDKLSQIGRTIRNNGRPWGGIQLVVTGDFFQLPPVPDGDKKKDVKFAFEGATWNTAIDHTIGLTQVFRQKDPGFAGMLNEMRLGRITEDTVKAFKALARPLQFDDGLEMTELFPTRYEVENSNQSRLRNLPGKSYRYDSHDAGDPVMRDRLLQNMMAPKALELKIGAQVMLIKNMDEGLVNGSLGKVIRFMSESGFESWSTIDYGSDLEMEPDAKAKRKIKAFSRELEDAARGSSQEYPVVEFSATDGTKRVILCVPEDWKVELPTGEVQASRSQLPLILAWALSIHKAQGQTLERVKVDLGKVFEKGQAYVALSRAVSQEGLQVLRFDKSKVMAHPRVVQFYDKLYTAEQAIMKKPRAMSGFANKSKSISSAFARSTSFGRKGAEVIDLDDDEAAMAAAHG